MIFALWQIPFSFLILLPLSRLIKTHVTSIPKRSLSPPNDFLPWDRKTDLRAEMKTEIRTLHKTSESTTISSLQRKNFNCLWRASSWSDGNLFLTPRAIAVYAAERSRKEKEQPRRESRRSVGEAPIWSIGKGTDGLHMFSDPTEAF